MPDLNEKDVEVLLSSKYGPTVRIREMKTRMLTKPGENYGSTMIAVDVTLQDGKQLSLVAKMVPESPYLQKVFQCSVTVRKEMSLYVLVSPEYEKLQREMDMPKERFLKIFPVCYGARATKDEDVGQPADENSLLLLENLTTEGYTLGDRFRGFNLPNTEFILQRLARFHAIAVGLKIQKPEVFCNTVLKACDQLKLPQEDFIETSVKTLEKIPECIDYIPRVRHLLDKHKSDRGNVLGYCREPFATIVHDDLWTNNMMLLYHSDDKSIPVDLKMVDFQLLSYNSPVKDLLFFLYTSSEQSVMENYYDNLVKLYHENFVECLKDLKCDTSPFSFKNFLEEIDFIAPREFGHIFFMLKHILLDKEKAKKLSDFSLDDFHNADFNSDLYNSKMTSFLKAFDKNGWL